MLVRQSCCRAWLFLVLLSTVRTQQCFFEDDCDFFSTCLGGACYPLLDEQDCANGCSRHHAICVSGQDGPTCMNYCENVECPQNTVCVGTTHGVSCVDATEDCSVEECVADTYEPEEYYDQTLCAEDCEEGASCNPTICLPCLEHSSADSTPFVGRCQFQQCSENDDCQDDLNRLTCQDGFCKPGLVAEAEEVMETIDMPLNMALVGLTLFEIAMILYHRYKKKQSEQKHSGLMIVYIFLNVLACTGFALKFLDWPSILEYREDVDPDSELDVACVGIVVEAFLTLGCGGVEVILDAIEQCSSLLSPKERKISIIRETLLILIQVVQACMWMYRSVHCNPIVFFAAVAALALLLVQAIITCCRWKHNPTDHDETSGNPSQVAGQLGVSNVRSEEREQQP